MILVCDKIDEINTLGAFVIAFLIFEIITPSVPNSTPKNVS